jgi:hypothetical protein
MPSAIHLDCTARSVPAWSRVLTARSRHSGGPLLNRDGQVVGIVVGILNPTESEFFVGIGFAVPITTAAGAGGPGRGPQY